MKVSVNWLKGHVNINIPVEQLAHKLTMSGLEVEKIEKTKGDTVMELEITPNRPDCLNVLGLAREAAAILNKALKKPKTPKLLFPKDKCCITIEDKEGCPRYIGTVVENVKISQAPQDMREKINALGMRPINNIVDITNFCLMETGQPMHAFDYDKLEGGKIIVRRARKGEKITTIDGVERELDPSILIIADAVRPVAIAGVMGGKDTEVTNGTKNIFLESAYFDPILIRRAGRKLGLSSESSYRFERGVDICMVEKGAERALGLIKDIACGVITKRTDVFFHKKKKAAVGITLTIGQVNSLLGASLSASRIKNILSKLEFNVKISGKNTLKVTPPSFRGDISRDVDVIEEISRVIGYDNLPMSLPVIKASTIPQDEYLELKKKARRILSSQGLREVISYTLMNEADLAKTSQEGRRHVRVKNPLTRDQEIMCPSGLPGLLSILRFNLNRSQKNVKIFELGKTYSSSREEDIITLLLTGPRREDWRDDKKEPVDFYDIKGILQSLFNGLRIKGVCLEKKEDNLFAWTQSAAIKCSGKEAGIAGKVKEEILDAWDIKEKNVFYAEVRGRELLAKSAATVKYKKVSGFPEISRDISIAVDKEVPFFKIKETASRFGKEVLKGVTLIEQYLGDKIPEGKKGIVFSLVYQSLTRTLTEEEITKIHQAVVGALTTELGAVIR